MLRKGLSEAHRLLEQHGRLVELKCKRRKNEDPSLSSRDDSFRFRRKVRSIRDTKIAFRNDIHVVTLESGKNRPRKVQLRRQKLAQRRAIRHQSIQ